MQISFGSGPSMGQDFGNGIDPQQFAAAQGMFNKFRKITLVIPLFIGVIFLIVGFFVVKSSNIDKSWTRIDGRVVSVRPTTSSKGGVTYVPLVEYEVKGAKYIASSNVSTSSYPNVGSVRQVAYDPAHPDQSKVVETGFTKYVFYIFPAIGAVMVVGSIVAWRKLGTAQISSVNGMPVVGGYQQMQPYATPVVGTQPVQQMQPHVAVSPVNTAFPQMPNATQPTQPLYDPTNQHNTPPQG